MIKISYHAAERMAERGITVRMIEDALTTGKRFPDRNNPTVKDCVVSKDIIIMIARDANKMITVFPTRGRKHVQER